MSTTTRLVGAAVLLGSLGAVPAGAQTPEDPEIIFNTGLTHLREGRTRLALEQIETAIKKDSKNPYFFKGLGVVHRQMADQCPAQDDGCRRQHFEKAVDAARKALELNAHYVDARTDLGTALVLAGKRDEGRQELVTAFNDPLNPFPETTALNIGRSHFEEGRHAEALNWFRTSARRNTHYAPAHVAVADTLAVMGRLDEALAELEAAEKANPDDLELKLALGQAYYRAARFSDARLKLDFVAGKDPTGPTGRAAADLLKKFPD